MDKRSAPTKLRRHRILNLVRSGSIGSQQQLSRMLRRIGIRVTQSTLSRDMRELGLVKARGTYVAAPLRGPASSEDRLRQALRQFVLDTGISGNILVLKTDPGNGHPLGVAIDAAQWPEVVGTVAGDDTVFVLLRSVRVGKSVLRKIGGYIK